MASIKDITRSTLRKAGSIAGDGWYFGDDESKNRLRHLQFNYTNNIIANWVGGNFFTGIMLLLNADDAFIGLMSIFVFSANLLQILSSMLLERFKSRKKLLIIVRLIVQFINIVFIGAIPLFPINDQAKLVILGASVLILNVLSALISPGFSVWHIQLIPQHVRVKYFSFLSMTNGIIVAVFNLIGSAIVDHFGSLGLEVWGFAVMRIIAFGVLIYDLFLLSRMKEEPYPLSEKRTTLADLLIKPFKETRYLRVVAFAFTWCLIANIPGSYYSVYLLRNLEVSYSFITIINMLNVPILVLLTPVWSRILHRFSWLKTCNIAILLYAVHYLLLGFIDKGNVMWLYPTTLIYAFILAVGINLSFTNVPYLNIPEKNQTIFISFYTTMNNLGALIGVTFGREFIAATESLSTNTFSNKQLLMYTVFGLMVLGSVIMFFLRRSLDRENKKDSAENT
ncbi:MAG: MFS transporter [Clostridia bacterium]|nr:MFS transporter [Clostridia bacterium]